MKKCILLFCTLLFISCGNVKEFYSEITSETNPKILKYTETYKKVNRVDPNLLSLDVYYTAEKPTNKPVIIWVHGGAWSMGDKSNNISDKVNLFTSNDYVFVSLNYRLSPFPYRVNYKKRIKHPVHIQDVADGVAWVSKNISKFGGDPNKIGLLGHSAGAHLVSLLSTNHTYLEQAGISINQIKGIASIDIDYDINEQVKSSELKRMYVNAFGNSVKELIEASPFHNINTNKVYPDFFIVKRGKKERVNDADLFIEKLKLNKVNVTVVDGDAYSHIEINDVIGSKQDSYLTPQLIDFYKKVFF